MHLLRASASLVLKQLIDVIVPPFCSFACLICSGIEKRTKRTAMCACMHPSIQNKKIIIKRTLFFFPCIILKHKYKKIRRRKRTCWLSNILLFMYPFLCFSSSLFLCCLFAIVLIRLIDPSPPSLAPYFCFFFCLVSLLFFLISFCRRDDDRSHTHNQHATHITHPYLNLLFCFLGLQSTITIEKNNAKTQETFLKVLTASICTWT